MRLNENRELREERAGIAPEVSEVVKTGVEVSADIHGRLAELEVIIDRGLQTYCEIGNALMEIRDQRLYRAQGFATFDTYCRERWGWNSRQVPYNYIGAAQAAENVQTSGHIAPSLSQAVELAVLPAEQQNEAVKAIESSGKNFDSVSVREVRAVVQEIRSRTSELGDQDAAASRPLQIPVSRTGDLWLCNKHRVLCDDSVRRGAVERVLDGDSADMSFCDPPYGVNYIGKTARNLTIVNDDLGAGFYDFLRMACINILAVTKGAIYVCMSSSELDTLKRAFIDAGGHWSTFIIWAKHHFTLGRSDYQRQYEAILYGWREGSKHYWCGDRNQSDLWSIKRPTANLDHPTKKPLELVERAIGNSSETGDTVLDLFGGSGTTMIACETLVRRACVIELEPQYCDVAVIRWQQVTGNAATLDGDGRTFDQIAGERHKLAA